MDEKHDIRQELAIILPSLDPDKKLCGVIDGLIAEGFEHIVIVDDGSDAAHQAPFEYAAGFPQCHILRHEVNKGKGRGLKDAFRYVLDEMPDIRGVVTIDGDGQHLTKDIVACGEKLLANEDKVVMGCRDFSQPAFRRAASRGIARPHSSSACATASSCPTRRPVCRAIPRRYLDAFCGIDGERFEYETNMLLNMKRMGIGFVEQRIDTVYDSEDYSSHYNAIKDSWRIFKVMFKFLLSSLGSTVIDLLVFYLVFRIFKDQLGTWASLVSTAVARACSSFANFNANNRMVFDNHGSYRRALVRYYCLCIPQMLVSAGLVTLINHLFANSVPIIATLIKFVVDTGLFFISYGIQREWVFSQKK